MCKDTHEYMLVMYRQPLIAIPEELRDGSLKKVIKAKFIVCITGDLVCFNNIPCHQTLPQAVQ